MALALAGCSAIDTDETDAPPSLGQFRLGHNIAVADETTRAFFSRELTEIQIEASIQNAVAARLRPFDGDGLYHLTIIVGGISTAEPGIPVVYAPKSTMILDVTVFDNDTREPLNADPVRIVAIGGADQPIPFIGSGVTPAADRQLDNLAANAARQIEDWLRDNADWFAPREGQVRAPYDASVFVPEIDLGSIADITDSAPAN